MAHLKDAIYKICLIGNPGVGKNTLFSHITGGLFDCDYQASIGAGFGIKTMMKPEWNLTLRLQFWDLDGGIRSTFVRPSFYRGSFGSVFVFDLTNRESFAAVKTWVDESDHYTPGIPRILLGNKMDLADKRKISRKEGEELAQEIGAVYYEISAKTGLNRDVWLENLVDILIKTYLFKK